MEWTYENYREHQSFNTLADLNEAVRQHLYYNASEFNKTTVTVLKTLSRYSCVVLGVSWLKVATLAKAIDKSEKTVRRALKLLEELNVINRIPTIRKKGGRGYDICVINKHDQAKVSSREESETASESKDEKGIELKETLTSLKTKIIRKNDLDDTYVSDSVPQEFRKLVRCYWDNAKTIEDYWRMTLIANCKMYDTDALLNVAIHSFKQTIGKLKSGAIRKKPIAYYYGVVTAKLDDLYYEELYELGFGA
ncbi:helix-turn-helix domain-containing protein [Fictibacillus nanhaiensis]|uniref:helix-turn-helix domain-containing protein n=1 Tax=Fictibacillus nanhaiensis TaxID=742169 RepID=UPI002041EF22|nr:helix-turn-helix domain-containing protein [Fictibacillus nanhaiensis]MCM3732728.1 helix-turn-helix domain-containing protein [Fictibacillus nanhaiensis]